MRRGVSRHRAGGSGSGSGSGSGAVDLSGLALEVEAWLKGMGYRPSGKFAHVAYPTHPMLQQWVAHMPALWRWLVDNVQSAAALDVMAGNIRLHTTDSQTAKEAELASARDQLAALEARREKLTADVKRADVDAQQLCDDVLDADGERCLAVEAADRASRRAGLDVAVAADLRALAKEVRQLTASIQQEMRQDGGGAAGSGGRAACRDLTQMVHDVASVRLQSDAVSRDDAVQAVHTMLDGEVQAAAVMDLPPLECVDAVTAQLRQHAADVEDASARIDLAQDAAALRLKYDDGRLLESTTAAAAVAEPVVPSSGSRPPGGAAPSPAKQVFGRLDDWASDSSSDDDSSDEELTIARLVQAATDSSRRGVSAPAVVAPTALSALADLNDGFEASVLSPTAAGVPGADSAAPTEASTTSGKAAVTATPSDPRRARTRQRLRRRHTRMMQLGTMPSDTSSPATDALVRTNRLVDDLRARYLSTFYRTERKALALSRLESAATELPTDDLPFRKARLEAALRRAEDHEDRLRTLLELRRAAAREVDSRRKHIRQFSALAQRRTDTIKWLIGHNHRLVRDIEALHARLKDQTRTIAQTFADVPSMLDDFVGAPSAELRATEQLDMAAVLPPPHPDTVAQHASGDLLALMRVVRAPAYAGADAACKCAAAVQEAAASLNAGLTSSLEDHALLDAQTEAAAGVDVDGLVAKAAAADGEKRSMWAPAVQSYLAAKRPEFDTLQAQTADALDNWWKQPAFGATPEWAVVETPEGGSRPLQAWMSEWAEVTHRLKR